MSTALHDTAIRTIVEKMKIAILADMNDGCVPFTCCDFAELHDHVDANMYADAAIGELGHSSERWHELANVAQSIVDQWLRDGRPTGS